MGDPRAWLLAIGLGTGLEGEKGADSVPDGDGMTIGEGLGFLRVMGVFLFKELIIMGGDFGLSILTTRLRGGSLSSLKDTGDTREEG